MKWCIVELSVVTVRHIHRTMSIASLHLPLSPTLAAFSVIHLSHPSRLSLLTWIQQKAWIKCCRGRLTFPNPAQSHWLLPRRSRHKMPLKLLQVFSWVQRRPEWGWGQRKNTDMGTLRKCQEIIATITSMQGRFATARGFHADIDGHNWLARMRWSGVSLLPSSPPSCLSEISPFSTYLYRGCVVNINAAKHYPNPYSIITMTCLDFCQLCVRVSFTKCQKIPRLYILGSDFDLWSDFICNSESM